MQKGERSLVSIEPDERGFWHVNYWQDEPHEEGVPCDGFATTKKGAPLDDAIALAAEFAPHRLVVWEPCETCGGTGLEPDITEEWPCDDCDDGLVCRDLDAALSTDEKDRGEVNLHQADGPAGAAVEKVTVPLEVYEAAVNGRREFRKLYRELRDRVKWRDISSAPRDGTSILWTAEDPLGRRTYAVITYPEFIECFDEGHWLPLQFINASLTADTPSTLDARGQLEAALTPVPQLQPDSNGEKNDL